ncbi:MAG TPA: hypothetical protein VIH52_03590 [Candidatus Nanoarchaeia archaeon]|nr:hypothetical protein [uncultured archaeon]
MSVSEEILRALDQGVSFIQEVDNLKYLPYKMLWGTGVREYRRSSVYNSLSQTVKKRLVKKRIKNDQVYLALTELGRKVLEKRGKKRLDLNLNKSEGGWDGLYRLIFFDIPEKDRLIRDTLRAELKKIGASPWQKSVWVTKENITQQVYNFILENNLEDCLAIVEVKEIYNPRLKNC